MRPTIAKQMNMPRSSRYMIGSLSHIRAIIDIQNGHVYQQIIDKDIGAIDEAELMKKKLRWPDILRTNNVYFLSDGKSLIGLYPFMRHHTIATGNPAKVRSNTNSIGLKPFSDCVLNTAR